MDFRTKSPSKIRGWGNEVMVKVLTTNTNIDYHLLLLHLSWITPFSGEVLQLPIEYLELREDENWCNSILELNIESVLEKEVIIFPTKSLANIILMLCFFIKYFSSFVNFLPQFNSFINLLISATWGINYIHTIYYTWSITNALYVCVYIARSQQVLEPHAPPPHPTPKLIVNLSWTIALGAE